MAAIMRASMALVLGEMDREGGSDETKAMRYVESICAMPLGLEDAVIPAVW